MLIPTYYLLSKNWDIFATRCRILLIINTDYFRGGEVSCKDRTKKCSRVAALFCWWVFIGGCRAVF